MACFERSVRLQPGAMCHLLVVPTQTLEYGTRTYSHVAMPTLSSAGACLQALWSNCRLAVHDAGACLKFTVWRNAGQLAAVPPTHKHVWRRCPPALGSIGASRAQTLCAGLPAILPVRDALHCGIGLQTLLRWHATFIAAVITAWCTVLSLKPPASEGQPCSASQCS